MRVLAMMLAGLTVSPANAALIDMGTFVRDTDQGLDWLKLRKSLGFTYNHVKAGAGGFLADGWRFAFGDELRTMFYTASGIPEEIFAPVVDFENSLAFIEMFECSASFNLPGDCAFLVSDDPVYVYQKVLLGWYDDGNADNSVVGVANYSAKPLDYYGGIANDQDEVRWVVYNDFVGGDTLLPGWSNFLVKTSPLPAHVPIPATLPLLVVSLGGLAIARNKRKSHAVR